MYIYIYFSFTNGLKEVDIVPFMFYQEETNLKHMQLTTTIWIDPVAVMQPWPEEENRIHVATRPFQLMVIGNRNTSTSYLCNMNILKFGYSCGLLFRVYGNLHFTYDCICKNTRKIRSD